MSIIKVKDYFTEFGLNERILEFVVSSATVTEAAHALKCAEMQIAKTLAFRNATGTLLIVTAGDAKIDNSTFKSTFAMKARMLNAEETLDKTGHAVGGVCPFALPDSAVVYLDVSLKRFATVFPACGSSNSAIELSITELVQYSGSNGWVDVCKEWQLDQLHKKDDSFFV